MNGLSCRSLYIAIYNVFFISNIRLNILKTLNVRDLEHGCACTLNYLSVPCFIIVGCCHCTKKLVVGKRALR